MLNELRMRRKKSPLSTRPGDFKETVSRKNQMGYTSLGRAKHKFKFLAILPKKSYFAHYCTSLRKKHEKLPYLCEFWR
jgi:hypothetical protein